MEYERGPLGASIHSCPSNKQLSAQAELLPGATFVVGADTAVRLVMPKARVAWGL